MDTEKQQREKNSRPFFARQGLVPWPDEWQKKEQALEVQLKTFLEQVVQSPARHSHWLNTLAFMEYIGCRKIVKSQDSAGLNLMLLQHISEEARHAFHFKTLAHRVSSTASPDFQESHMLKGAEAEDYFQAIDRKVAEECGVKTTLSYFYTTWLIEERALMVYNIYNGILKSGKLGTTAQFNLDFILREEDGHLKTTTDFIQKKDPDFKERGERLLNFEQNQFTLLLKEWQKLTD